MSVLTGGVHGPGLLPPEIDQGVDAAQDSRRHATTGIWDEDGVTRFHLSNLSVLKGPAVARETIKVRRGGIDEADGGWPAGVLSSGPT